MCYNVRFLTKKRLNYLKRLNPLSNEVSELETELDEINTIISPTFITSAFSHPLLPVVIANEVGIHMKPMQWGLVPGWVKDPHKAMELQKHTLNARVESILTKSSFKESAVNGRGIVLVDGYFEHQIRNGDKIPHHIVCAENEPLFFAALYTNRFDSDRKVITRTCSIITAEPSDYINDILFNNALDGRMPLLLTNTNAQAWLRENDPNQAFFDHIVSESKEILLTAYPVRPLSGKKSPGNCPLIIENIANAGFATQQTLNF